MLTQNNNECNNCRGNSPTYNPTYGFTDNGAIQKHIKVDTPCVNKVKTQQGLQVILPYGSLMQATHGDKLKLISLLSTNVKIEHIYPHLQSVALIFIVKLCNYECTATFTATNMTVEEKGKLKLEGNIKAEAGMWQVHLSTIPKLSSTPPRQSANKLMT